LSFYDLKIHHRLASLCVAIAVAGTIVSLLGFLGRFHWFLDLFSHFRVQYGLVLAVFSLFLFMARRWRTAVFSLAIALLNLAQVLPLYWSPGSEAATGSLTYRLMLLNVNTHLGDPVLVSELVASERPDILLLQEINKEWVESLNGLEMDYPHRHMIPREDNFGIGLYSRHPLQSVETVIIGRDLIPSIAARLSLPDADVDLLGTHPLPPVGRDRSQSRNIQIEGLTEHTRTSEPFILAGDLNTTPWNFYFRRLLHESGLRDSARGFGVQATWPRFGWMLRIPLDHCLHSDEIIIVDRRIGPDVRSDHFAVIIDFQVKQ
jgi:endonuclease/exonuclease/phosphatase (EEP) superfamily protein YafD